MYFIFLFTLLSIYDNLVRIRIFIYFRNLNICIPLVESLKINIISYRLDHLSYFDLTQVCKSHRIDELIRRPVSSFNA